MKPDRWKKIDQLFDAAMELDPSDRAGFLDEACGGDEILRNEIESLLASDQAPDSFFEAPIIHAAAAELINNSQRARLTIGESVGPYKVLSLLGAGGMGEVYRARDSRLERDVAVKVLPEHLASNRIALSRFEREAKALAALSHPNILTIFDIGTHNGIPFAIMELLKGETLRDSMKASKLSINRSIEIAIAIAEGLVGAHSAGVIHRDLKPENIFLTIEGPIKILDFGLARRHRPSPASAMTEAETISQTEVGVVAGTVPYMSPEQVRGETVDTRTDIFSLGCVLYEMISREPVFRRKTAADTIMAILSENPPELSGTNTGTSPQLDTILQRCLKKNPDERFQSARDLVFALKTTSSTEAVRVVHHRFVKPKHLIAMITCTLIILAGLFFLFTHQHTQMRSIAILPFANGSSDVSAEYLSDGITESIINSVSRVPNLTVMARGTVFTYKGREIDPRKIGRELNVEAVVTGRVIQQGNLLIVRADLVKVADGSQLWGEQFNRRLSDLLAVQDEISTEIAQNLRMKLTGEQAKRLTKHYTEDPEAYRLYLKAHYYHYKEFSAEDYIKSLEYLQQAIAKDPAYALAHAEMADLYTSMAYVGLISPKESYEKSKAALNIAQGIDDKLFRVIFARGLHTWSHDWNWISAEKDFKTALTLEPSCVECRHTYAQSLIALGRDEEGISQMNKVHELDPLSISSNKHLATLLFWSGNYDQAIDQYKQTLELDPNAADVHDLLGDVYERKKMYKEAVIEHQKALNLHGDEEGASALIEDYEIHGYEKARQLQIEATLDYYNQVAQETYISPMTFAILYAKLNQRDQAFQWLEKAFEERSPWITYIRADPEFDNIRSDPRFDQLLKRIGLPS